MPRLECWFEHNVNDEFSYLTGETYDDPRFPEGFFIKTSPLKAISRLMGKGIKAETKNTVYELGEELIPTPEPEAQVRERAKRRIKHFYDGETKPTLQEKWKDCLFWVKKKDTFIAEDNDSENDLVGYIKGYPENGLFILVEAPVLENSSLRRIGLLGAFVPDDLEFLEYESVEDAKEKAEFFLREWILTTAIPLIESMKVES